MLDLPVHRPVLAKIVITPHSVQYLSLVRTIPLLFTRYRRISYSFAVSSVFSPSTYRTWSSVSIVRPANLIISSFSAGLAEDAARAADGNISLQLRNPEIDNTHLNEAGYTAMAYGVYEKGVELGYW